MTPARERVLDVAERLFAAGGYAGVTLRDIAEALGMRQASLYHHAPGGKAALYVEVVEWSFRRHRAGMEAALAAAGPPLGPQLQAAGRWLLSQPPVTLTRIARSDIPQLAPQHAERITLAAYEGVMVPLQRAIVAAQERGEVRRHNPDLIAGAFLALVDGIYQANRHSALGGEPPLDELVLILLDGVATRSA